MSNFEKDLEEILKGSVAIDIDSADPSLIKEAIQIRSKEKYGHGMHKFVDEFSTKRGIHPSKIRKIMKSYKKTPNKTSSMKKTTIIKEMLKELDFSIKENDFEKIYALGVFGYLNEKFNNTEFEDKENTDLVEQIKYSIKVKANKKYNSIESFNEDIASKLNMTPASVQLHFARTKNTKLSTLITYQQILNYLNKKEDLPK